MSQEKEDDSPEGSSQRVVVKGGDWSHATLGNKTVNKIVVNTYNYRSTHAHGDTSLQPGQFGLTQRIIVDENDPISRKSQIFRAKLQNKLLGDKEIFAKILDAGKRQMREAKCHLSVPHHPNLVERIAADTFKYKGQNCIYIAMEQCDPLNLEAYVQSQIKNNVPFDLQQYMSFSYQIALGVEFLHRHNIIHRDLRPSNIFMSADKKTMKVSNFGFSNVDLMKDYDNLMAETKIDLVELANYMWHSPELLEYGRKISLATDIYSLAHISIYLWSYGKHLLRVEPWDSNWFIARFKFERSNECEIFLIPNGIEAKDLLKPMLEPDPSKRPTAKEVIRHGIFRSLAETRAIGLTNAMEMVGLATSPEQMPEAGSLEKIAGGIFSDRCTPLRKGYKVFKGERRYEGGVDPTPAAIKFLDIIGNDDTWPTEYLREVNNMKKIHNPYVVQFIECGKVEVVPYQIFIATKLCHTNTLQDIDISGIKTQQRWDIFLHICHGLKSIHGYDIAHRDLKPSNILFSLNGEKALIADFGLSKDVKIDSMKSTVTRSSAPRGTQGWVAVELLRQGEQSMREQTLSEKNQRTDFLKADIFSLGSVGHFTLCNKHLPFCDDKNPTSTAHQHVRVMDRKPPHLQRKLRCIEDGEIAIDCFKKMLSHTPKERPGIEKVLRHCMFWSPIKKVNFFREMHQHFKRRNLKENGTEEQQLACELVRLAAEADSPESDNDTVIASDSTPANVDDEPQFQEEEITEDEKRQAAIFSEITGVATEYWLDKVKKPVAKATRRLGRQNPGESTIKQSVGGAAEKLVEKLEKNTDRKPASGAIPKSNDKKQMQTNEQKKTREQKRSDEIAYKNTVEDLIRYIRNFSVHRTNPNDPSPCKTVWELFSPLFPKLLPYLFKIMELSFNEEDKHQFMEEANPRPIDIKHLLDA